MLKQLTYILIVSWLMTGSFSQAEKPKPTAHVCAHACALHQENLPSIKHFAAEDIRDYDDMIVWSDQDRLSWKDFKGTQDHTYKYRNVGALTYSGIMHAKSCKDGYIIYDIQAFFEPNNSWVKKAALTDHHLAHEQLHFDITELYARMLRYHLAERKYKCGEEVEFERFIDNFSNYWQSRQMNYDLETSYSLDYVAQKKWMNTVLMELSLYQDYAYTALPQE